MPARRGPYLSSSSTRGRLRAALEARPGCTRADLARAAGVSWRTAAHHLRAMQERGEVRSERAGRMARYWVTGSAVQGVAAPGQPAGSG